MSAPTTLAVGLRTDINAADKISFANSPIHLRIQNALQDATIESVTVYLWIWNGAQNKTLGTANYTLEKDKVSVSDTYINIQIADLIKSFIEKPTNAQNGNNPTFIYNEAAVAAVGGLGCYWQITADITSAGVTTRTEYNTYFATLGYRWNYEQNIIGNNGITPNGSLGFIRSASRYYDKLVHDYIEMTFDLSTTVATSDSFTIPLVSTITPPVVYQKCSKDPYLIVFLNKLGLWEYFTPFGKVSVSSKVDGENVSRAYRDPSMIDNSYVHSKLRNKLEVTQSYTINTGLLTDDMVILQ